MPAIKFDFNKQNSSHGCLSLRGFSYYHISLLKSSTHPEGPCSHDSSRGVQSSWTPRYWVLVQLFHYDENVQLLFFFSKKKKPFQK